MKTMDPGHEYFLDSYDGGEPIRLVFVKREGEGYPFNVGHHPGTNCQEVIRALIDRVKYLQKQIPCDENERVINNLRSCLWEFEKRAAKRHGRASVFPWQEQYQPVPIEEQPTCLGCGHVGCEGQHRSIAAPATPVAQPATAEDESLLCGAVVSTAVPGSYCTRLKNHEGGHSEGAYEKPGPVAQPEAHPVEGTPLADAWREWFRRAGEHATSEVVNATANLVISEREIHASTTATPTTAAVEAARAVIQYLDTARPHPTSPQWDSLSATATAKTVIQDALAAIISRYLPAQQPEVDEALQARVSQAIKEIRQRQTRPLSFWTDDLIKLIQDLHTWLGTERSMHAAWRKRADEAEVEVERLKGEVERLESDVARFSTLADERHDLLCSERRHNDEQRWRIVGLESDLARKNKRIEELKAEKATARADAIGEAIECVPVNWLDTLLTGPDAVIHAPYNNSDIERLLQGIKRRIESVAEQQQDKDLNSESQS